MKSFCCSCIETCIIPVLVSFFLITCPLFWPRAHFKGWHLTNRKKPNRFPDVKFYAESFENKIFKNNHYSGSLLDPENWCILAQFDKFEQIWGTVKGRTFKLKKDLKIQYVSHFICLLTYSMYPKCKISKKCMPVELLVVQNWGKMAHLPLPTTGTFLKISYNIPLLSVMTIHYNRLYQISSLEANFSSKDMK